MYNEYEEEYEDYDSAYDDNILSDEDIFQIQEEYRKKRLRESLIGPVISTLFHVGLIIILAILITDKYKPEVSEIEVKMQEVEEIQIEEPPSIEEPVPEEVENTDTTDPVLTTVALENVKTNDSTLEDVSDDAPSTEDDSAVDAVSDVTVSPSAFASPSVFSGRSAAGRSSAVSKFGGSQVGQQSLLKALWWLAKVQNPDGSWGSGFPQAYTGLALLTFLAHSETQSSKNFGTNVRKAMEWLAKHEHNKKLPYAHAIKTYALAEAYAMTGVSMLEEAMNKNIRLVIDGMQKGGSYHYGYNLNENEKQDLSVAGWNYQALKAAYGAGCEEKGLVDAIHRALGWLKKKAADSNDGNGFPYDGTKPVVKSKSTMRAVGVLCMQLFGEGQDPALKDEIKKIADTDYEKLHWKNAAKESLYSWYYATQAMFQNGGNNWKKWNKRFQRELTANQHPEGYWEHPSDFHSRTMDDLSAKVYATTLCALQLTVYYRYLPSSKGAIGGKQANAKKQHKPAFEEEDLDLLD